VGVVIATIPKWIPEWSPGPKTILQTLHICAGCAIVLASVSLGFGWWSTVIAGGWIVLKEGVFDLVIERSSVQDELIDAAFYVVGAGLAGIVLVLS
jgi:hypothetical protein